MAHVLFLEGVKNSSSLLQNVVHLGVLCAKRFEIERLFSCSL